MLSPVMKHTTCATNFDVKCVDAVHLAPGHCVLRGQHRSVGRRFITIGLDLHASGDSGNDLAAPVMLYQLSSSTSAKYRSIFVGVAWGTVCCSGKDEREISYMDESVVEGSENACDAKDKLCESTVSLE